MATVFRPRAALWTAIALSAVLVLAAIAGWVLLPAEIRDLFTGVQLGTLVFFVLVMVALMLGIGLSSVRVGEDGLLVRNGVRVHRVGWDEIEGFRLTPDDPWASVVLTDDPGTRPLMALQRVDGARARAAVAVLEELRLSHRPGR
ncbi:MAG: PH domain-containing protein [Propionicimonas sp.]|nr:PH domain-containing protein [Propionicimonas sp.]